jgi:hypothetical protein
VRRGRSLNNGAAVGVDLVYFFSPELYTGPVRYERVGLPVR